MQLAPVLAFCLCFMLLDAPLAFTKDLQTGTIHHKMDRIGQFYALQKSQSLAPARERGEIWHRDLGAKQADDAAHQALGLAQRLLLECTQSEANLDRQV